MKITINDQWKLIAVQEAFNVLFPYLKIQFSGKADRNLGFHPFKGPANGSTTIKECRTVHRSDELTINPMMTVSDLEEGFRNIYGLGIQVLRKSGKIWLETTVTDGWTLEEQNRQGEALSRIA